MFDQFGQFASLLRNLPKLREEMEKMRQNVSQITAEGVAGGDMVKVRVNGKMEILACELSDEALRGSDKEMLEDLIRAATNQALDKVRTSLAEETARIAASMGLPAGMGLPGLI